MRPSTAEGHLFGTLHVVEYQEEPCSHLALTFDHSRAVGTWAKSELPPGQALRQRAPLFKKLDESVIEEEYARLEGREGNREAGNQGAGTRASRLPAFS